MIMDHAITILDYSPEHRTSIRQILARVGWAEQYIVAAEQNMHNLSQDKNNYGVYVAATEAGAVGFLYVQYYAWNQLCQIHGLAVHPELHRQGVASALVARAEKFARSKQTRGIYVDTPTTNTGGRNFYEAMGYQVGYIMPRYYEDKLDGVTYQKFFEK
jgi:ribosomal protein S18 acetylase RimI-like enzyme